MTFEDYYDSLHFGSEDYDFTNDDFDFAEHFWRQAQTEAAKEIIVMIGESKLMLSHDIGVLGKIAERFISNADR